VDAWNLDELRSGLAFGAVGSGLLLVARIGVGRRGPVPLAGVLIAAGGLWTGASIRSVPSAVLVGVLGVGAAAAVAALPLASVWYGVALAVPFAWAIGFHGDVIAPPWGRALVTAGASGGAMLAAAYDSDWRPDSVGLTLLVISSAGMYATVPDTELAAAAFGVVLPFVLLGWPLRVAALGRFGTGAAVAMLLWAGAVGAAGRPASVIGLVECLGLLAGHPLGKALLPRAGARLRRWSREWQIIAMVISHALFVTGASRVVGSASDPFSAAVLGAILGVGAVLVGAQFSVAVSPRAPQFGDAS
jgi:hypothetical protein